MFQRKWSIKPCVVVVLTMNDDYSCGYCARDDDCSCRYCAQDAHLVWEQDAVGGIPVVRLPVRSSKRPSL